MRTVAFGLLAVACWAQPTVFLRHGGPDSRKSIKDVSSSTPVTITAPGHSFRSGDLVYVSFVGGMPSANGVKKVGAVTGPTFSITELDGTPVAPNGGSYLPAAGTGFVGKVQETQLVGHPRILADGPDGQITARIKDPDGNGSQRAPAARDGYAPWEALKVRLSNRLGDPANYYGTGDVQAGETPWMAAMAWFADNRRTADLQSARHWINNIDKFLGSLTFAACDEVSSLCGKGSYTDWGSFWAANMSYAYSLIREQLSPAERQAFADKLLNGVDGGACENTFQTAAGTLSVPAGSTKVAGTGTKFTNGNYAPGRWIHFRLPVPSGFWAQVASVESDTELTLRAVLSRTVAVTNSEHGYVGDWRQGSCGKMWFVSHHAYTPAAILPRAIAKITSPLPKGATEAQLENPALLPSKPPFFLRLDFVNPDTGKYSSEWVKVTQIQGKTIQLERGQFSSPMGNFVANRPAYWTALPTTGGLSSLSTFYWVPMDDPRHNLSFTKIYGYLVVGLALADDDPRARMLVERAWNYYYDFTYPHAKDNWTGITQGGYTYGVNRWQQWTFQMALYGRTNFNPAIDIGDGNWLKKGLLYPLYIMLPHNQEFSLRYGDSGIEESLFPRHLKYLLTGQMLYPQTDEARYANYWFHSVVDWFSQRTMQSPTGYPNIPFAMMFADPSGACVEANCMDYRKAIPPYHFFTESDYDPEWNPNAAFQAVVSKQNWSAEATMLFAQAFTRPTDHIASYPAPGGYRIIKGEYLLADNGNGSLGYDRPERSNYVEIDGANRVIAEIRLNALGFYGQNPRIDKKIGSDDFVYFRVDSRYAYAKEVGVNRAFRHFVHLKGGPQDYVVVYDDVATVAPKSKKTRLHYYADKGTTPEFVADRGAVVFTRASARLSSRVLLPAEPAKFSVAKSQPSSRETVNSLVIDDGVTSASEFLVVHRPSNRTNDEMPPVSLITEVSAGFRGVHIGGAQPRVVVFAREEPRSRVSFAFTGREALIVVTGLQPGFYSVTSAGSPVNPEVRVDTDGTFSWTGAPGEYTIRQTRSVATLEILTDSLQTAVVGQSYSAKLRAAEGTPPYRWEMATGILPPGLELTAEGEIRGVPEAAASETFSVRVFDSSAPEQVAERGLTLTVVAAPTPLEIMTGSLPNGVVGSAYEQTLAAQGGISPYRWSIAEGSLPPGLALGAESGAISGTPQASGVWEFAARVTDSAGASVNRSLAITVDEKPPPLQILTETLPTALMGDAYVVAMEATGGVKPYRWAVSAGSLPAGITLSDAGDLTGTPEQAGTWDFEAHVRDSGDPAQVASRTFSLVAVQPLRQTGGRSN